MSAGVEPPVLVERDGAVLIITLNRPEAMNALDGATTAGLLEANGQLESDPTLAVGLLTGRGKGFCSGMDLKAFAEEGPPKGLAGLLRRGSAKPLVGAIEGFAFAGGLELALLCDLLAVSKGARLGISEVKVGLVAAGGGILRLPQRLPAGVALEMALTGEPITAEDAFQYGFVSRLTEPGGAFEAGLDLARLVAKNAPLAVALTKQLMRASRGLTDDEYFELQKPLVTAIFASADAAEGPRTFAQKREPIWTGR
jgi:enoyl-CoA hydratase